MTPTDTVIVKRMMPPGGSHGDGLHWFRVTLPGGEGRCFITNGEAQHLHQLTTDWVERAIRNLASVRGWYWLETRVRSSPGLMLHHSDAYEFTGPATALRDSRRFRSL
jgi:hypothetical protein